MKMRFSLEVAHKELCALVEIELQDDSDGPITHFEFKILGVQEGTIELKMNEEAGLVDIITTTLNTVTSIPREFIGTNRREETWEHMYTKSERLGHRFQAVD